MQICLDDGRIYDLRGATGFYEQEIFMIAFDLQCSNGHTFEGWFDDRDAFEDQLKRGLVSCPMCDDHGVFIVLSTFAIPKAQFSNKQETHRHLAVGDISRKFTEFLENNFDDVGTEFTREALKIHYGVVEPRNIRGISSAEEEKLLEKEGIPLLKIPISEKMGKGN